MKTTTVDTRHHDFVRFIQLAAWVLAVCAVLATILGFIIWAKVTSWVPYTENPKMSMALTEALHSKKNQDLAESGIQRLVYSCSSQLLSSNCWKRLDREGRASVFYQTDDLDMYITEGRLSMPFGVYDVQALKDGGNVRYVVRTNGVERSVAFRDSYVEKLLGNMRSAIRDANSEEAVRSSWQVVHNTGR